jgi:hypothetical protein
VAGVAERNRCGRFGNYVPPVLEALGMAEVEHNPRDNRIPQAASPVLVETA